MQFLELVELRLDYVQGYHSANHYRETRLMAARWVKEWPEVEADAISLEMVERFLLARQKKSAIAANKEIRYLKSLFNWGKKRAYCASNPIQGIPFFPTMKRVKQVPSPGDMERLLSVAEGDDRDYILVLRDTLARVNEVNQMLWSDVFFADGYVVLYTRKKKGGHLTPRKVFMTARLRACLEARYARKRQHDKWVFTHRYYSRNKKRWVTGPYLDRKTLMARLCKKAGLEYFRYHAIRHSGASALEKAGVSISAIQHILGHESRLTTEIYLHVVGNAEQEAMRVFERLK